MSLEFIEQIEKDVQNVKETGQQEVNVDRLLSYLANLKKGTATIESLKIQQELARYEHERNLEQYKANNLFLLENAKLLAQSGTEMFKSVIATGKTALQSAILINGGAAAGLLAFIGGMWSKSIDQEVLNLLGRGTACFAVGALAGAFATGATYFCQMLYGAAFANERQQAIRKAVAGDTTPIPMGAAKKVGILFHCVSVIAGVAAYVQFWHGLNNCIAAFSIHFK